MWQHCHWHLETLLIIKMSFTGSLSPFHTRVHTLWCKNGGWVCPSPRHPRYPWVWHSGTHAVLGQRWVLQVMIFCSFTVLECFKNVKFFSPLSQARWICSLPVTRAPTPLAPSDRWTPFWTPRMTSWDCSSRRSALCSLMPMFTWGAMRSTSPAGRTLSEKLFFTSLR